MDHPRHFPSRDRLSVLTAVVVLAYTLTRFLELPTRQIQTTLFGSPLGLELNGPALMLLLVAALTSTGADTLIRSHPHLAARTGQRTVVHWILPGATALVLGAALNRAPAGPVWWVGLGLSALGLIVVLTAEYTAVDRDDPGWQAAALGLMGLAYLLVLILFVLLRTGGLRAVIAAPVSGLVAAAVSLRLLALREAPLNRAAAYSAAIGVAIAEVIWAITYWRISPIAAGLLALVPFYVGVGLAQQQLAGRLTRGVWLEYGIIGGLSLGAVLLYALG